MRHHASKVKKSAAFIAQKSHNVRVDVQRCKEIAEEVHQRMQGQQYSPATWRSHELNPSDPEIDPMGTVDWIFTIDCSNFSFWNDNEDQSFKIAYNGEEWTGYWSMVAAINRALDEDIPITTPTFWLSEEFTLDLLHQIFRSSSSTEAPLLPERFAVLKEAGRALKRKGFSSFSEVLEKEKGHHFSALNIVHWVTENIYSFNDAPLYKGEQVFIYKRAQILVADIWACFKGQDIGRFDDIDEITMFADYRVPQISVVLGCLQYSFESNNKIRTHEMLLPGSPDEVEIRGCSIEAVEVIVREIKSRDPAAKVNAVIVDFYLWDTAKEQEKQNTEIVECHRTRSVYY